MAAWCLVLAGCLAGLLSGRLSFDFFTGNKLAWLATWLSGLAGWLSALWLDSWNSLKSKRNSNFCIAGAPCKHDRHMHTTCER